MNFVEPVTLAGKHVTLEPLSHEHVDALTLAARDGDLWRLWYTSVPDPAKMAGEIERRLDMRAKGQWLPFAVRSAATGALCGMTNFLNIDAVNRRVEIGGTWYGASVQRSGLNTEAKLMLLGYAFETLQCIAVEFRTHFMNQQSRTAIARLGAKQDGILRNHQILEGGALRDTVVFSIIESEWPAVKRHLQFKLDR